MWAWSIVVDGLMRNLEKRGILSYEDDTILIIGKKEKL